MTDCLTPRTLLAVALAVLVSAAHADPAGPLGINDRPSVNVTGDAEIRVVPDLAVLRVRVQHCGTDLVATRTSNQESAKAVLAAAREVGGKPEDQASTPSMSFPHRYNCPEVLGDKERELGHTVTTELTLRLESMEQIDPLITALSARPEVTLQDVEYRTTELRKYRDEVRAKAVTAAREKAQALAVELGQNIGPAIWISADNDIAGGYWSWSQFNGGGSMQYRSGMTQNVMMNADSGGTSGGSELAASGKITVRAQVNVRFELRP